MRYATATALVLLASGCGGGDDRLSKEEFQRQASAVCADYDRRVEALGQPESVEEVEGFAAKAADLTRQGVGELRDIRPPEEFDADYDRFLVEGDKVVALSERLERAARDRDADELQKILAEAQQSDGRSDRIARRLGLDECAED